MAKVFLSGERGRGLYALVDEEDLSLVEGHSWCLHSGGYAYSNAGLMHHLIIGLPPKGMETDHGNRNKLDNRRSNLAHVTPTDNRLNSGLRSDNTTGANCVYRRNSRPNSKRPFFIAVDGKYLGSFKTVEEAVAAVPPNRRK